MLPRRLFPNRARVFDPDEVTTRADEVDPRDVGLTAADVQTIWDAIVAYYKTGLQPGMALCVRYRGQVLLDRTIGHLRGAGPGEKDPAGRVVARPDHLFSMFSASKCVLAMLVHQADDRGLLHLDDPVEEYIPGFGAHGKEHITVRHVLSHRAGIPALSADALDFDLLLDSEAVVERLCSLPVQTTPGRELAYHAVTGGFILSEVLHRVTGLTLNELLDREVRKPLGLKTFRWGVAEQQLPEVARESFTGPRPPRSVDKLLRHSLGVGVEEAVELSNDPRYLTGVVPSANLIGTANEVGRFFELLRCGGVLDGEQVFERRTVRRAVAETSYHELDDIIKLPIRYSMGFMLGARQLSFYGAGTAHAFGHLGFTNVLCWSDPARELSVAFLNNGKPILDPTVVWWLRIPRVLSARIPVTREGAKALRPPGA